MCSLRSLPRRPLLSCPPQATPLLAGLGVAAAAYTAKQMVQLYVKMRAAPPAMRAFYKVCLLRSAVEPVPLAPQRRA